MARTGDAAKLLRNLQNASRGLSHGRWATALSRDCSELELPSKYECCLLSGPRKGAERYNCLRRSFRSGPQRCAGQSWRSGPASAGLSRNLRLVLLERPAQLRLLRGSGQVMHANAIDSDPEEFVGRKEGLLHLWVYRLRYIALWSRFRLNFCASHFGKTA